jgi:two-component system chemotaxis response regulator CheY
VSKRILIVDDIATIRQMERLILVAAGFEVVEAVDGMDAMAKLAAQQVQLVLTDLNMPILDGTGLVRAIRDSPEHRLTPVVMVTTEADYRRKLVGLAAGVTGWIEKPFTGEQLLTVVRRLLGE